jgi:hypothetical protein
LYKILVGKLEGKRPLAQTRRKWEYNIKMNLKEIWWEVADWIHVDHDMNHWRGSCEHSNEPSGFIKVGESDCIKDYQLLKENSAHGVN